MIGLTGVFSYGLMWLSRNNRLISLPKIRVTVSFFVSFWNLLPEFSAGRLVPLSNDKSKDWSCSSTQSDPQPSLILFLANITTELIELKNFLFLIALDQTFLQIRKALGFFLTTYSKWADSLRRFAGCLACSLALGMHSGLLLCLLLSSGFVDLLSRTSGRLDNSTAVDHSRAFHSSSSSNYRTEDSDNLS